MVRRHTAGLGHLRDHVRLFLAGVFICYGAEQRRQSDPRAGLACRQTPQERSPAETWRARKSVSASLHSALFATVTTDASCGAVNSMHDSYTPLGGLVPLFNIQTDEVIFGGVGAGLYGMLLFAILAVFIAGLMVGRTPEYLGKKIEQKEVKMAMLALIATCVEHPGVLRVSFVLDLRKDGYWNPPGPATGEPEQQRTARLLGDPLCVRERHGQ